MPGIFIRNLVAVGTLLLLTTRLQAQIPADPLSVQLMRDAADGQLDEFSILEAALIAGGLEPSDEVSTHVQQFQNRCEGDEVVIRSTIGSEETVNAVLNCLHRRFLTGEYRSDYSEFHRTLADGHF